MPRCYCCLLVAALVSASALSAQQDDICPIVGRTDLTNLVTVTLNSMSQGAATTYQILRYQVVCLAQGAGKDQYRMTSVIIVYQQVGGSTQFIGQFQFLCENAEWSANLGGLGNVVSTGQPTGNLSTPVRTDCRFCSDSSNSTSDEHCFVCPANCTSASRCDMSGNCCNLFSLSGACASQCPGNSTINSEFQCTCDRGYTSNSNNTECVEVDECASAPCLNNGTCQDRQGDFTCLCHNGFSGETCEICKAPFCRTCMLDETGNQTVCVECKRGYALESNECQVDECASAPCLNNGICQDRQGDFTCQCLDGFSGETCEICNAPFCRTCTSYETGNQMVCVECNTGYALESNECRKCELQNCLNCFTQNFCIECESSYELANDNSSCDIVINLLSVYIVVPLFVILILIILIGIGIAIYNRKRIAITPVVEMKKTEELKHGTSTIDAVVLSSGHGPSVFSFYVCFTNVWLATYSLVSPPPAVSTIY